MKNFREEYKVVTVGFFAFLAGLLGLWIAIAGLVTGKVKNPAGADSFNTFADNPFAFTFAVVAGFTIGLPFSLAGILLMRKGLTKLLKV